MEEGLLVRGREVIVGLAGENRHGVAEVVARAVHGKSVVFANIYEEKALEAGQWCFVTKTSLNIVNHRRVGRPDQLSALVGKQAQGRYRLFSWQDDFECFRLANLIPAQIFPNNFDDTCPSFFSAHRSLLVVGGRTKQTTQSLA